MAKLPSMPLFCDAYLGDTMPLSLEEHGAYLKILIVTWNNNGQPLPDDDVRMARILGISLARWRDKIKPAISPFFDMTGGTFVQSRLEKEWAYCKKISQNARDKAVKSHEAKYLKKNDTCVATAHAQQVLDTCLPIPIPIPIKEKTVSSYEDTVSKKADADASATRAKVEKSAAVVEKKKQVEAECKAAVDCWNEMAAANKLSEIEVMTASRKAKLAARIKQAGSIERFMSVIREMPNNPFFLGDNGRNWLATFDFVLQEKSFTKLLENGYDRNKSNRPNNREKLGTWDLALEEYRRAALSVAASEQVEQQDSGGFGSAFDADINSQWNGFCGDLVEDASFGVIDGTFRTIETH